MLLQCSQVPIPVEYSCWDLGNNIVDTLCERRQHDKETTERKKGNEAILDNQVYNRFCEPEINRHRVPVMLRRYRSHAERLQRAAHTAL